MATRQQIQIAQDLVRFVNIMNDLLDCASYILKGIDPQMGTPYQIQNQDGTYREATLEELKAAGKRAGQNVLGYRNTINQFITRYGAANVRDALLGMDIDVATIQSDVAAMETQARNLNNYIDAVQSKAKLVPFAESIDTSIPKLILVRRSWCLGL